MTSSVVVAYGGCWEYLLFWLLETFTDIFKRNSFATQHSYTEYLSQNSEQKRVPSSAGYSFVLDVLWSVQSQVGFVEIQITLDEKYSSCTLAVCELAHRQRKRTRTAVVLGRCGSGAVARDLGSGVGQVRVRGGSGVGQGQEGERGVVRCGSRASQGWVRCRAAPSWSFSRLIIRCGPGRLKARTFCTY